jgi:nitrogen regulatory protein PII
MDMVMIVFRTVHNERVHELLRTSGVIAYTKFPQIAGTGQSGTTEGSSFYAGENSVILASLDPVQRDKVADSVKIWIAEAQHAGWVKPVIRVFSWPCSQLI